VLVVAKLNTEVPYRRTPAPELDAVTVEPLRVALELLEQPHHRRRRVGYRFDPMLERRSSSRRPSFRPRTS